MDARRPGLRPDLQKTWEQLEKLPPRSVVVDEFGDVWQSGGYGYWYRAFDAEGITPFEMAQRARTVTEVTF